MSHAILSSDELEVVVGNNEPGDGRFSGHLAGYNGIWSLQSRHAPDNCFFPSYAGLNFEHCYDQRLLTLTDRHDLVFEPRNAPMHLTEVTATSAVLHQPPTSFTGVESWTRFALEGDRIEFEFRARLQMEPEGGWLGMFWASYMHGPANPGLCFLGHWPEIESPTGWMTMSNDTHGETGNVMGPEPVLHPDGWLSPGEGPAFATLIHSLSHRRYAEPMFYGRPGDGRMMLLHLFEPIPGFRIVQSPSGGGWNGEAGTWNPAWDFHVVTRPAVEGQEISLRGRVIYIPFESREDVIRILERWKIERSASPGKK
jgi:hypothetical protein